MIQDKSLDIGGFFFQHIKASFCKVKLRHLKTSQRNERNASRLLDSRKNRLRFRFVGQLHCTMETLDFWTLHRQLGECYQLNVEAMQDGDAKQPKSECINMITAQLQSFMCVESCMKAILWIPSRC